MRVLRVLIVIALSATSVDLIAARPEQGATASVSGTASDATGRVLFNTAVQLRSVSTGQLVGRATTNASGQFSFVSLAPGTYVVEVANTAGQIVGTSGSVVVSAGAAVTGVGVTASAAAPAAAAAGFGTHHVGLILGVAAAAGVAGGVAMASGGTASPSQ